MRNSIFRSILVSLEWRVIAFIITNIFFWVTTGHFWKAAGLALLLQVFLFVAHTVWYFLRFELRLPLMPREERVKRFVADHFIQNARFRDLNDKR